MGLDRNKSALGAFYRRIKAREDTPTVVTATAAKIGRIIYAMVTKQEEYRDIGADYYEKKHKKRSMKSLKRRASSLGYKLVPKKEKSKSENDQQQTVSAESLQ